MQQKSKDKTKKICKIVIACTLIVAVLAMATTILERKSSIKKYNPFFEQKEPFDILFLGTSHIINGVIPAELYHDYGYVSFNMGGHSNQMATTYWMLRNALDYTVPQLVIVDAFTLNSNYKTSTEYSYVHMSLDAFPLSMTKINTIYDLLDDDEMKSDIESGVVEEKEKRTPLGLLWDFSVYHSRWNELEKDDFNTSYYTNLMGSEIFYEHYYPGDLLDVEYERDFDIPDCDTVGAIYLRKIIELCQERGIDILMVYMPYISNLEAANKEAFYAQKLADEYGINYINFLDAEVVNYRSDLINDSHLNYSGALKITHYLGNYIDKYYDIPDRRMSINGYNLWNDMAKKIDNNTSLEALELIPLLLLLRNEKYEAFVKINEGNFVTDGIWAQLMDLGYDEGIVEQEWKYIGGNNRLNIIDYSMSIYNSEQKGMDILVINSDTREVICQRHFE